MKRAPTMVYFSCFSFVGGVVLPDGDDADDDDVGLRDDAGVETEATESGAEAVAGPRALPN
jgi:hypothetical protein